MAKFTSANCRCAKTRNSKALASKPQYFPPEKIFIKGASSEGRIFLRGKKTTNFERIAHLNTEFDGPKVAHFNAWKTEKKWSYIVSRIQANPIVLLILSQFRSFPLPKSTCVLLSNGISKFR